MRIFNQLVFDGYVSGTADVFTDSQYDTLLGMADQLSIGGYSAQVQGSTPTLTVQVEGSFDQRRWQSRNATAEVNGVTLAAGGETNFQGQDGNPTARPTLAFARLRIRLGGTGPNAQIRIWASGRDRGEG
jgi:hypothetical protein